MLEIMRSDYIRTARAKGLSEWTVLLKHALRGGIIPVVSFTGPALAALLAGTVVVERVFSIPGLGNIFINAVLNRDDTLVIGIVAFLSILIMIFNLIVDISYGFLDPRIRYD
jgi:ABC-type dipeptide/oligopeptide/nickel transport systems, permease components